MLRQIDTHQFNEIRALAEIEPFGEDRMDIRFAILASVIAGSAGAKAKDGQPYSAEHFLRALRFEPETEAPKQSLEYQTQVLNSWIDGSNRMFAEKGM